MGRLDHWDSKVRKALKEELVILVQLEAKECKVTLERQDRLVLKGSVVFKVFPEPLVELATQVPLAILALQECKDFQVSRVTLAQQDYLVYKVPQDKQEPKVNLEQQEQLVIRVRRDKQAPQAAKELQDLRDLLDQLDQLAALVQSELAVVLVQLDSKDLLEAKEELDSLVRRELLDPLDSLVQLVCRVVLVQLVQQERQAILANKVALDSKARRVIGVLQEELELLVQQAQQANQETRVQLVTRVGLVVLEGLVLRAVLDRLASPVS